MGEGSFSRFFLSDEIHLALLTAMIHPSAIPYSFHSYNSPLPYPLISSPLSLTASKRNRIIV